MYLVNHLEAKNTRFYKLIDKGESQFLRYENLLNLIHAGMQNAFFPQNGIQVELLNSGFISNAMKTTSIQKSSRLHVPLECKIFGFCTIHDFESMTISLCSDVDQET